MFQEEKAYDSVLCANQKDIDLAVNQCLKNNNNKLIILIAFQVIPQENELNLNYLNILKKFPIYGYSDHSIGEMELIGCFIFGI